MRWRPIPLRWLVSGVILATSLLVLAVGFWVTIPRTIREMKEARISGLVRAAQVLAEYHVSDLAFGTREEAAENLTRLARNSPDILSVALYDAHGDLFAKNEQTGTNSTAAPKTQEDSEPRVTVSEDSIEVTVGLMYKGERYGSLHLTASTHDMNQRVLAYWVSLAASGAGLFVLAVVVAFLFQRIVSRPVLDLARAARKVSEFGDWTIRLPERGPQEVVALTRSFNSLLQMVALRESQRDQAEDARRRDAERYTAELERRVQERTAELEASNRELEAFGYSIAHDLRAPLRSIHTFSTALQEDYANVLDESGRDHLRRVIAASERMNLLIRDLLEYSRVSAGQIETTPVDLDEVLDSVVAQWQSVIEEKGAVLDVQRPLGRVMAHRPILEQVVTNLLSNALKFVAEGVRPQVRIWSEPRPERLRLWIEDNGIGIDPAHHQRIFRLFERLHSTAAYPGTGVGLALVKRGIERMGGAVGVESSAGGSRFWVELLKDEKHDRILYRKTEGEYEDEAEFAGPDPRGGR